MSFSVYKNIFFVFFLVNLVLNDFNRDYVFDGNIFNSYFINLVIVNLDGKFIVNVLIIYIGINRSKYIILRKYLLL